MTVLRSALFLVIYVTWTLVLGILYLPFLVLPAGWFPPAVRFWLRGLVWSARAITGIGWRIEGRENLPDGPCLIAAKHQSAWETLFLPLLVSDFTFVLKRELLAIPLVGWHMRRFGVIAIDRGGGGAALKGMLRGTGEALAAGRQVIVFPEGTRVAPGGEAPYHVGIGALYQKFGDRYPVVPVAVNSGLYWRRKAFLKTPGTVVVRILPALPAGLGRAEFMAELRARIETATREIGG